MPNYFKVNNKKFIESVEGYGVCGYRVQFSVEDLYRLNALAMATYEKESDAGINESPAMYLSEAIRDLFCATIGTPTGEWSFLKEGKSDN